MKKTKIILSLLFLMSFNEIVPMDGGFAQGGGARGGGQVEQNDYLTPDDFASFIVEQFTLDGVDDFQQFIPRIADRYNRRLRQGLPLKQEVIKWIDEIVSERQPQAVAVELTPKQLEPVDLHCSSSTEPYFVTRQTSDKLKGAKHPALQCEFTALDLPESFRTWVSSGKLTSNAWKAELDKGCQVSAEEFNLTGLPELVAKSPVDASFGQAIAPSLEQPDADGYTRLILAILQKDNDEVKRLIEAGADVNAKLNADPAHSDSAFVNGEFPLYIAAADNLPVVELLIKAKADVNNKTSSGGTALMRAARKGNIGIVKFLLDSGADVDAQDGNGETALMDAAEKGHVGVAQALIGAGADVNAHDADGWTALMSASLNRPADIVNLLIDAGAEVNAQQWSGISSGRTALMIASLRGNIGIVRRLLESGADVNIRDNDDYTAAGYALKAGNIEIANLLMGAIDAKDSLGMTALIAAALSGNANQVRAQLKNGADVNAQDNNGMTALMHAAERGHVGAVQILLQACANVNAQDNNRMTALMHAAERGHDGVVEALLAALPILDVDAEDFQNRTALLLAGAKGHSSITRMLKNAGAKKYLPPQ